MELERARTIMQVYLADHFGKLVELGDVEVIRSSSGRMWKGGLFCPGKDGPLQVGTLAVSAAGDVVNKVTEQDIVESLLQIGGKNKEETVNSSGKHSIEFSADDFGEFDLNTFTPSEACNVVDGFDNLGNFFQTRDFSDLRTDIITLLSSGDEKDLWTVRDLMPQLLSDPDRRGFVLRQMGELEIRLGNSNQALEYFEAAAREFADHARIEELERLWKMASSIGGDTDGGQIRILFEQSLARMQPIPGLEYVPAFSDLASGVMGELERISELVRISKGLELLREGDPATHAFVLQSGVLSVRLAAGDGASRLVRCCYPGDFIGESSVLEPPGATCTATLTAERETILWQYEGARFRQLVEEFSNLKARIMAAKELHCLDSFFSMHQITNSLDVQVRDHLLGCVSTIRRANAGEILGKEGALPEEVYLLASGKVELRKHGRRIREFEMDSFVGLSDALHELPLEGDFVATENSRLVVFDIDMLKTLADQAPPEVVTVLERL